jgi:predicted membrane protein
MAILFDAVVALFDIYMILSFYRKRLSLRLSACSAVCIAVVCIAVRYLMRAFEIPQPMLIVYSVAICFGMTFLFRGTWKQRMFYPLLVVALEMVAEIIAGMPDIRQRFG